MGRIARALLATSKGRTPHLGKIPRAAYAPRPPWVGSGQAIMPTGSKNPTAQLAQANGAITVASPGPARATLALRKP